MLSFLWVLLPFFALMTVGAFIGPLVMGGWSFSLQAITPKLEKVDPLSGMKRIFSLKSLLELLKSLLKFVIILIAAYFFFVVFLDDILVLGKYQPILGIAKATHLLVWGLILLSSSLLFVVFFDVPFQLWDHTRQLRMTRQEVRDEMKETDGRPEVKSRIRNLQREISQRRMMADVPTADVIITNPTHYAVALKYHKNKGSAPIVVAKGQGLVALKIRSLGLENAVPICEVPALARALYGFVDIGAEIPQNLYLAVAKVLAYVYQLRSGQSPIITMPEEITVPDDYAWTPPEDEGASA